MPITQVTIALSALADPAQVASAGAALAVRLGVALEAMLFEDRRLLQLAERQLLQRVRWPGGGAETLTAAELESEFLIHRSTMRVALEAAAREAGIGCAIRVVADLPGEQTLPVAGGIAVVSEHGLMGYRRDLVRRLLGHVTGLLLLPSDHQPMRRPAVLLESAPRPEFLALALELARRIDAGHPTEIIVAGTADPQVEAETRRLLVELGVGERAHLLNLAGLPGWSDRLPEPIDSLIVSSSDPANAPGELDPIPDRGRRPVLLLRAGAR